MDVVEAVGKHLEGWEGGVVPGGNCIKIGLPGKLILGRLFSREYDFPKTFSLTEKQFSGKTYFYTIHPWRRRSPWGSLREGAASASWRAPRAGPCPGPASGRAGSGPAGAGDLLDRGKWDMRTWIIIFAQKLSYRLRALHPIKVERTGEVQYGAEGCVRGFVKYFLRVQ